MSHPLYHKHIRKRVNSKKLKPFPSNKLFVRALDSWVSFLGIAMSFSVLPQVIKIYGNKTTEGLSIITWAVFTLWGITMLIYGLVHSSKPIIATYLIGTVLYGLVFIGIVIY